MMDGSQTERLHVLRQFQSETIKNTPARVMHSFEVEW